MTADISGPRAGSASGFMNMGAQLGGGLTALLTPVIAQHFGWTYPFLIAATLSALGAVAWLPVDPSQRWCALDKVGLNRGLIYDSLLFLMPPRTENLESQSPGRLLA